MTEKELCIQNLMMQIRAMPELEQKAICWLIGNMEIAKQLAEGEKAAETEVKRLIQKAIEKEDHAMLALVLYKESRDKSEKTGK